MLEVCQVKVLLLLLLLGQRRLRGQLLLLPWQQKERGDFKKAILSENDYTGGSLSADILHALPGFFFSFHYLKNLACASSEMRRAVQNPQHWNDRCISLNSVEFTDGLPSFFIKQGLASVYGCSHPKPSSDVASCRVFGLTENCSEMLLAKDVLPARTRKSLKQTAR